MKHLWTGMLLAGCLGLSTQVAAEDVGGERKSCQAITISTTPETRATLRPIFHTRQVLDLNLSVVFPSDRQFLAGETIVLRFFTPTGHIYQEMTIPVGLPGTTPRERELTGYPFPVAEATPRERFLRTEAGGEWILAVAAPPLPIAGTSITNNSLYGVWRAEAWSQGSSRACQVSFQIAP